MKFVLSISLMIIGISGFSSEPTPQDLSLRILRVLKTQKTLTGDQSLLLSIMGLSVNKLECAADLEAGKSPLNQVPIWIQSIAERVFKGEDLSSEDRKSLERFRPKFPFELSVAGAPRPEILKLIKASFLKTQVPSSSASEPAKIEVLWAQKDNRTVSAAIRFNYRNGEIQNIQFDNVSFGELGPNQLLAELIVVSLCHRPLLSDPTNLRKEVNALAYNLKKLRVVVQSDYEAAVVGMIDRLEESVRARNIFQRQRVRLGKVLLTYVSVKKDFIGLAQSASNQRNSTKQSFERNFSKPVSRVGRISSTVRSNSTGGAGTTENDSNFWASYYWMTDPGFMLSHPLFWGAKDNSAMGVWMMFDHLSEARSAGTQQWQQPSGPNVDLNQFASPVDPIVTNDSEMPFRDPWQPVDMTPVQVDPSNFSESREIPRSEPSPQDSNPLLSPGNSWDSFNSQSPSAAEIPGSDPILPSDLSGPSVSGS